MKHFRFLILLALAPNVCVLASKPASRAVAAFEKLQSLAGNWEGKGEGGETLKTSVQGYGRQYDGHGNSRDAWHGRDGHAVQHRWRCHCVNPLLDKQPATHARAAFHRRSEEAVFSSEGAGNLPTPETGHEHKLVIEFEDKDHITERWTWRKDGKETESVYRFVRKGSILARGNRRGRQ